ncbi:MAG: preprotein translocase subunit TatA [Aquificota bacterium]|nr:preprotein translocase subunit TatA [Aquificota bacterium]MDQ7082597.1 preprotein translocase subunit TatA [Aquificota bacterium]
MELQLLLVLLIAFLVLGPERMMDLAVKLGEMMRKVREVWEEIRLQAYMEEMNRKVLEEEEIESKTEDETEEEPPPEAETEDYNLEDYQEVQSKGEEDGIGERTTAHDAPDRAPEGTEDKTA